VSINVIDEQIALIVIDLQAGTVANPTAHPTGQVVARAGELLSAFRQRELLVVLATVDGTPPAAPTTAKLRVTSHPSGTKSCPNSTGSPKTSPSSDGPGARSQVPISPRY
jgi:nicotinamidase-related amidase